MRATPILFVALLLPSLVHAQGIHGRVLENGSDTPVAHAIVDLMTPDSVLKASAESDSAGWFRFAPIEAGHYLLRPSHPSYQASRTDSVTVSSREIVSVVIRMGRAAIPLEPLVVTTRSRDRLSGYRERLQRRAFGQFIEREEIERMGASTPTGLLQVRSGVRIVPVPRAPGALFTTNMIMMRGGAAGQCVANVYIDGFPARQYADTGIDDMLTLDAIEGVEIYSNVTAPAEFLSHTNNCGVVAFWTREGHGKPFTWKRLAIAAGFVLLVILLTR